MTVSALLRFKRRKGQELKGEMRSGGLSCRGPALAAASRGLTWPGNRSLFHRKCKQGGRRRAASDEGEVSEETCEKGKGRLN